MVLAAGRGKRLAPLTNHYAKPLVPVGDRPVLAHIVDQLRAAGLDRIVVNAHHRAQDVLDFARRERDVVVSEEKELLGTAGGVARARELLGEGEVLVWNGDILARPDLGALRAEHARSVAEATLAIAPLSRGQGSVGVDAEGRIVRLRTERIADEARSGEFIGVHVIGARLRALLPSRGCLVGDAYIPALGRGETLRAFWYDAPFFDVGTLRRYLDANLDWLVRTGAQSYAGPRARIAASVHLQDTVVGTDASIVGAGTIARCVVLSGGRAAAPLADAVVMGDLVVDVGA